MIHQIGRKLRQQIHYFSGELCKGIGCVASRFVGEAVFGISASESVRLTEIGRALEEKIKQSYDFEDIRVLTYTRLKNMGEVLLINFS